MSFPTETTADKDARKTLDWLGKRYGYDSTGVRYKFGTQWGVRAARGLEDGFYEYTTEWIGNGIFSMSGWVCDCKGFMFYHKKKDRQDIKGNNFQCDHIKKIVKRCNKLMKEVEVRLAKEDKIIQSASSKQHHSDDTYPDTV